MKESTNKIRRIDRLIVLVLSVSYTSMIMAFLFAMLCVFYLNINGPIVYLLFGFSGLNLINTLLFFKHRNLTITYNIMSALAFVVVYGVCLYSGGINSMFSPFLVLLIFSGYTTNRFYGKLWLIIVSIAVVVLYILRHTDLVFENYINEPLAKDFFSFFSLAFLVVLLGWVFGRLMSYNTEMIYRVKRELSRKNEEKAVMLKEIHHRVKNNLQLVNSLLRIQSRDVDDEAMVMKFKMAQSRIVAMARLHEKMYDTSDLEHIDLKNHFEELIHDLRLSYNPDLELDLELDIVPIKVSIDTLLPLSLIINELISNSLKFAFENSDKGKIIISLSEVSEKKFELIIGDNGVGMDSCVFNEFVNSTSSRIIRSFVRQLNGKIESIEDKPGTHFKVSFSEIEE